MVAIIHQFKKNYLPYLVKGFINIIDKCHKNMKLSHPTEFM